MARELDGKAAVEQLLRRLAVPFERTRAVFVPLGNGHRHD